MTTECPSCHSKKAIKTELSLECPDCLSIWYIGPGKEKRARNVPIGSTVTVKSIGTNRIYTDIVRWSESGWFLCWSISENKHGTIKKDWQRIGWYDFMDLFDFIPGIHCRKTIETTIRAIRTAIKKQDKDRQISKKGGEKTQRKHHKKTGDYVRKDKKREGGEAPSSKTRLTRMGPFN